MREQFQGNESGHEEVRALVELLREINFDLYHPKNGEMNEMLVQASHEHPEWVHSTLWHRLIGSTPDPKQAMVFDVPNESVSAFIKKLAEKFLS